MLEKWLGLFSIQLHGETKATKPTIEEAISAWENDPKRNKEGNKIVRGADGKPIEIVTVHSGDKPIWAIHVNGENIEQFQIRGSMQSIEQALGNLRFSQFLHGNILNGWYEIGGVQLLDAQVSKGHQGFVFGLPGMQPDTLQVNFRAA